MKGKNRCRILKDIRRRIAEENGIEYVTSECKYKGDCLGTCPKCESEVRYLERELEKRRSLGYKVTVAGLAAGITLASTGCSMFEKEVVLSGDVPNYNTESSFEEYTETAGVLPFEESSVESSQIDESEIEVMGQVEESDDDTAEIGEIPDDEIVSMLAGDIPVSDYE